MPVIRTSSGITYNIIRIRHVLITYIQYTMDITSKNTLGRSKNMSFITEKHHTVFTGYENPSTIYRIICILFH